LTADNIKMLLLALGKDLSRQSKVPSKFNQMVLNSFHTRRFPCSNIHCCCIGL